MIIFQISAKVPSQVITRKKNDNTNNVQILQAKIRALESQLKTLKEQIKNIEDNSQYKDALINVSVSERLKSPELQNAILIGSLNDITKILPFFPQKTIDLLQIVENVT